ncbi:hypothetical protein HYFRA_00004423 [Hymenoscyphus fraxineus]|uniref:BTB domain-containing protein n=1 Tax=Hymenoscyphus fraxineus TaxID=746836 RepID=A0A9N9KYN3_9HELO|nr:hypothetical protein HYFRA_00004423 [Hymenoscyphus fraxineus]
MAPRKRKRARVDSISEQSPPTSPLIFRIPGQTPDTLLSVLGQDYHVHSMVLKLHSNYFRRFLDSPDKSGERASQDFRYHYVTVIDDDEFGWSLESIEKATSAAPAEISRYYRREEESSAFHHLICAMYNRKYTILDFSALKLLTETADFFCALPIVSATIIEAVMTGPMTRMRMEEEWSSRSEFSRRACEISKIAPKLRNPILFRDAIIEVVSRWDHHQESVSDIGTKASDFFDRSTLRLIEREYARVSKLLARCSHLLLLRILDGRLWEIGEMVPAPEDESAWRSADFYHRIRLRIIEKLEGIHYRFIRPETREALDKLRQSIDELLQNNLVLDQSHCGPGELGMHEHAFLCAEISDDDLPWDTSEIDW